MAACRCYKMINCIYWMFLAIVWWTWVRFLLEFSCVPNLSCCCVGYWLSWYLDVRIGGLSCCDVGYGTTELQWMLDHCWPDMFSKIHHHCRHQSYIWGYCFWYTFTQKLQCKSLKWRIYVVVFLILIDLLASWTKAFPNLCILVLLFLPKFLKFLKLDLVNGE